MKDKIQKIIKYLNTVKTRCTYGVVAEILGVNSRSVGMYLGKRRPERIIKSAEVLRRNIGV